ncbi:MAG: hypothetical protein Q4C50_12770 [Eubacteriales bacterium]|nr:hypothetical protein [Eubacteriales bacterium]
MKKTKAILMIVFMMAVLGFGTVSFETKAEAATLTNVLKAPSAKKGQWVISSKGYRYRYTATKKYAKSAWLKINGNVYYFKSNGYLQTGWKTYKKHKYYFNKNGVLQTGWQTIGGKKYYFWKSGTNGGAAATGKVKIASKWYYFSSAGVMKTGWQKIGSYYYYFDKNNGSMAVNKKIGNFYVDKNGRRKTAVSNAVKNETSTTAAKTGKVDIFVGDSRTVGMGSATGTSSKCIAKVGEGYSWFVNTAEAQLKKKLKSKPSATVVINLGVNDIGNYNKYITRYKKLIKSYPKAKFYFMSVNPIDSKYNWGYYSCSSMKTRIKTFNNALKKAFPKQYIDCYTYLNSKGFSTVDGIHYNNATYKKIYNYILTQV